MLILNRNWISHSRFNSIILRIMAPFSIPREMETVPFDSPEASCSEREAGRSTQHTSKRLRYFFLVLVSVFPDVRSLRLGGLAHLTSQCRSYNEIQLPERRRRRRRRRPPFITTSTDDERHSVYFHFFCGSWCHLDWLHCAVEFTQNSMTDTKLGMGGQRGTKNIKENIRKLGGAEQRRWRRSFEKGMSLNSTENHHDNPRRKKNVQEKKHTRHVFLSRLLFVSF